MNFSPSKYCCGLTVWPSVSLMLGVFFSLNTLAEAQQSAATSKSNLTSSETLPQEDVAQALARRGSITLRDTPLTEVILLLSQQWQVNIVAGSQIDGQVSGTFKSETLQEILDSLLTANGYKYRKIGNSLVIVSNQEGGSSKPNFEVKVIDIPVGDTEQLNELIDALKLQMSPEGQIQPIMASGKLAISDSAERILAVEALLREIVDEGPSELSSSPAPPGSPVSIESAPSDPADPRLITGAIEIRPQFVVAKDLEQPLGRAVGADAVSIIESENMIVVFGDRLLQQKASLLVQQLDRPRPQVRITGYIYDVDLDQIERLGVDWNQQTMTQAVDANGVPRNLALSQGGLLTPNPPSNAASIVSGAADAAATATTTATDAATAAAGGTGGQFLFRTISSNYELQTLVQALDENRGSRLLADPHVTVLDRHTASLGIVTEIPVQQLTQTGQGGAIGTTSFREAGIKLDVTPHIAADGTIRMEVSPEFSVLAGFQQGNPIIDTRRASTVVRVINGQALVIGGLRSKTVVETVKGIPGLMDIKFVGKLFRAHDTEVRESELLVFIMPEIVGHCGGLPREMHALDIERNQLSRVQTACDGPFSPDCGDKHCPHHHPRPVIHNGMHDRGLIGAHDLIFIGEPDEGRMQLNTGLEPGIIESMPVPEPVFPR